MKNVKIGSLIEYIEFIAGLSERAVNYRGAKDPVEDMKPTVVRSWEKNRRIRQDRNSEPQCDLWDYEARLIEAFQRQSLPFLESVPNGDLNWLAVAQHYQLPTRLLDWTRNPLIALYFAATNRGFYQQPEEWDDVYVFMWEIGESLHTHRYMLPLERIPAMALGEDGLISDGRSHSEMGVALFSPLILSSRIASQEGLFSFEEKLSGIPFPDIAEESGLNLTRITVAGPPRLDILKHLNRLGVETGKLFPDLPGLCAHQKWVAEWLW